MKIAYLDTYKALYKMHRVNIWANIPSSMYWGFVVLIIQYEWDFLWLPRGNPWIIKYLEFLFPTVYVHSVKQSALWQTSLLRTQCHEDFSSIKLQPFTNIFVIISALYSDINQSTKTNEYSRDAISLMEPMSQKDSQELMATAVGFWNPALKKPQTPRMQET